jgi:hypothetical protein
MVGPVLLAHGDFPGEVQRLLLAGWCNKLKPIIPLEGEGPGVGESVAHRTPIALARRSVPGVPDSGSREHDVTKSITAKQTNRLEVVIVSLLAATTVCDLV